MALDPQDRVKEDHLFSDKEVFVTSAYRKKLEEQKKWLEDEKRKWVPLYTHVTCV
jgi:coiled-coil domain-containing protein 55